MGRIQIMWLPTLHIENLNSLLMKCTEELLSFSTELLFPTESLLLHVVSSVSWFQKWTVRWKMALSVAVFYLGQRMLVHFHTMWGLFWLSELVCSVLSTARAVVLQGSRLGVWFILSTRKPSRTTVKNTVLAVWRWESYSTSLMLRAHLSLGLSHNTKTQMLISIITSQRACYPKSFLIDLISDEENWWEDVKPGSVSWRTW